MYKFERYRQIGLADFNQPFGLKMNPENRWIKKAETIPWDAIEERYAKRFPSKTGMPEKPLRTALGSLLIQKQLGFSDRELVEESTENQYLQYFIGLPGFQTVPPFVPSLLVEFRKRLNEDILREINEMIIAYNTPDDPTPGGGNQNDQAQSDTDENAGTMILDAIIDDICDRFYYYKPRMKRLSESGKVQKAHRKEGPQSNQEATPVHPTRSEIS